MKTLTINIPDSFGKDQISQVESVAYNQIEDEIRKTLAIPVEEVARVESEILEVKESRESTSINQKEFIEEVTIDNAIIS